MLLYFCSGGKGKAHGPDQQAECGKAEGKGCFKKGHLILILRRWRGERGQGPHCVVYEATQLGWDMAP